ncbi:DNA repair ATPase [Acanthopleuribacter pedis]|uniref:DNA repair ATPase n=1 Tax=Acanthopleuribacter pedis TaxID=442870 RepID=A0A8J7U7Q3_9BACT|nr:DNA repair ATPase [Acanthopleuribacter pedis]MBO1321651.1 DNA repair ATPase [Acanthopleuribacter pedis]
MSDENQKPTASVKLEEGTYEIIRGRLQQQGTELRARLDKLNQARKDVFGTIENTLIGNERISTDNNCVPRDMIALGPSLLLGYNVQLGLRSETHLKDVFAVYTRDENGFHAQSLNLLEDPQFDTDFRNLYKYYKKTYFSKFMVIGPHLFMKFRVGQSPKDFKTFKWFINDDGTLKYVDNRSDHEFGFPVQHEFEWLKTTRDMHREGRHPHVSIEDRVFVETVGGDLTIKVEDNTADGNGIYAEPVEHKDQTLDDAEIHYALVGHVILLRIRPYQEKEYRYLVFNEKLAEVHRIDAIEDTCVLLPDDHGLIFPRGYYLLNGELKTFDSELNDMVFERRVASPNGEDFLFVFYNRATGFYILLSYNLIEQKVATPITCHGYTLFDDGTLAYMRTEDEPQKHHAVQLWRTAFLGPNVQMEAKDDSPLFKIGNKDIVRCMAECHEILTLINKEEAYDTLYIDLVKKVTDTSDTYFWLSQDACFNLAEVLHTLREAAKSAIDEFEKVTRIQKATREEVARVQKKTDTILREIRVAQLEDVNEFVRLLAEARLLRGEIISTRERRYVDLELMDQLEEQVREQVDGLSNKCVEFLLQPEALQPYEDRVAKQQAAVESLVKVTEANEIEAEIDQTSKDLEMLIEIVSNLKIDDATQTTRIIDGISAIYGLVNRAKTALRNKRKDLARAEGVAEFAAQMKLLSQSITNYLDVCDTPEKCEGYLTKIMVQLEELESRFSEFDAFIEQMTEKREQAYNAFEAKRLQLVESRNRRAAALAKAADRVLKGIANRVAGIEDINEINGYFAGDMMIEKVREIVSQLQELEDTVKADDIQSRLKTLKEDTVRQLRDKRDLFGEGGNTIKMGNHQFSVNQQALALTIVKREDDQYLHLTGTDFFEKIEDEELAATRPVWDQEVISENRRVYRAEYLAYLMLQRLRAAEDDFGLDQYRALTEAERQDWVRQFAGPRYAESYGKGVHDYDAFRLLDELTAMAQSLDLLVYPPQVRACAAVFWHKFCAKSARESLQRVYKGLQALLHAFPEQARAEQQSEELEQLLNRFLETTRLFPAATAAPAAAFLAAVLLREEVFPISQDAGTLYRKLTAFLKEKGHERTLRDSLRDLERDPAKGYQLVKQWVAAYLQRFGDKIEADGAAIEETAALFYCEMFDRQRIVDARMTLELEGLRGDHGNIEQGRYLLNYHAFTERLAAFAGEVVPMFTRYTELKQELAEKARVDLRLDEFQPRVLSSFVRNKLIDQVYLPLIGDNLAKQIGTAGESKRTDRMGLLLLVSPPGYGKTTLMEYIANRLGLIFMKINGPAIGHDVTALDPASAAHASAREELKKLNLALEMGDNIMIYLDDIQHCNPEFLQKFISLCDGSRRIEGVYKGRTRTYDLRGKKVAVCMAGNPYTESGDRFQIPDMLANRADTYNLGDIIGETATAFELSYIENALTSNPVLNKLATKSQQDVYSLVKIAETGSREGVTFEGSYGAEEVNEYVNVMKKLLRVRDIILKVNLAYIESAAQEDAYRTEPPFKLQGSYRNMNKIAEKVLPVMNDSELEGLITTHYDNEAQTLTSGAEANLLKFAILQGAMDDERKARWAEIIGVFRKKQSMMGVEGDDKMGQALLQLMNFNEGLSGIRDVLGEGMSQLAQPPEPVEEPLPAAAALDDETLAKLAEVIGPALNNISGSGQTLARAWREDVQKQSDQQAKKAKFLIKMLRQQFELMQHWIKPSFEKISDQDRKIDALQTAVKASLGTHGQIIEYLKHLAGERPSPPAQPARPTAQPAAQPAARPAQSARPAAAAQAAPKPPPTRRTAPSPQATPQTAPQAPIRPPQRPAAATQPPARQAAPPKPPPVKRPDES